MSKLVLELKKGSILLDRFVILEKLGNGGMGVVYKAEDRGLSDDIVALKVLLPQFLNDEAMYLRFRKEVVIARTLSHPNIVRTHDLYKTEDGICFLSMEYVEGESFKSLKAIPNEKLSEVAKRVLPRFIQLLEALSYAHSKGVVHRDLKPANIIISIDDEIKIADFGTARLLDDTSALTQTGFAIGTPDYMSPEHIKGDSIDQRSDIYSLGILLYELITGERPFRAENAVGVAYKHVHEVLPDSKVFTGVLGSRIFSILLKATKKDSNERLKSAIAFKQQIEKVLFDFNLNEAEADSIHKVENVSFDPLDSWTLGSVGKDVKSKRSYSRRTLANSGYSNAPGVGRQSWFRFIAFTSSLMLLFLIVFSPSFVSLIRKSVSSVLFSLQEPIDLVRTSETSTNVKAISKPDAADFLAEKSLPLKTINSQKVTQVIPELNDSLIVSAIDNPINKEVSESKPDSDSQLARMKEPRIMSFMLKGSDDRVLSSGDSLNTQALDELKWEAMLGDLSNEIELASEFYQHYSVSIYSPRESRVISKFKVDNASRLSDQTAKLTGSFNQLSLKTQERYLRFDMIKGEEILESVFIRVEGEKYIPPYIVSREPVVFSNSDSLKSNMDGVSPEIIPLAKSDPEGSQLEAPRALNLASDNPIPNNPPSDNYPSENITLENYSGKIEVYQAFAAKKDSHGLEAKLRIGGDGLVSGQAQITSLSAYEVSGRSFDRSLELSFRNKEETLTLIGELRGDAYEGSYVSSREPGRKGLWVLKKIH